MKEIICPNCNKTFTIDENAYNDIVSQIRDKAFQDAVNEQVRSALETKNKELENALLKKDLERNDAISLLKQELEKAKATIEGMQTEAELEKTKEVQAIKEKFRKELAEKDEELRKKEETIAYYKDFKSKLSTKMIGESLEQYCLSEFNKHRAIAYPNAYFEKDNEVVDHSKADFIFRDYEDDLEYVSIIFEMKTENDETKTKHKNEDFLAELDKDRRNKKIEYAVLVSTLESDNDFYNVGIADLSYRYDKTYVIRPQFFLPIISLLSNMARKNASDKKALMELRQQNADVSALEEQLNDFKFDFSKNVENSKKKFDAAIKEVDISIKRMQNLRDFLLSSQRQLDIANSKVGDMTMRKLLSKSPSLMEEYKTNKKKN